MIIIIKLLVIIIYVGIEELGYAKNQMESFLNQYNVGTTDGFYSLDGTLIGSPHMDAINNFKKSDYGLHPLTLQLWQGFIFINLSSET